MDITRFGGKRGGHLITRVSMGPVVRNVERTFHEINHYLRDNLIGFGDYPLDSALSTFEQLGPNDRGPFGAQLDGGDMIVFFFLPLNLFSKMLCLQWVLDFVDYSAMDDKRWASSYLNFRKNQSLFAVYTANNI